MTLPVAVLSLLFSVNAWAWNANLTATPNPNTGDYTLTWTINGTSASYRVQERLSGTSSWTTIFITNSSTTSYDIVNQPVGDYEHRIWRNYMDCPGGGSGGRGGCTSVNEYSESLLVSTVATPPLVPGGLTGPATDSDGAYTISWNSVSGATSYNLEEALNGGSWSQVYSGASTSLAINGQGSGAYSYRVRACNGGSNCSAWSAPWVTTIALPPAVPAGLTGPSNDPDGNYPISWNASAGSTSYMLEEQMNGGAWIAKYTGSSLSYAVSGNGIGTYGYRVKGCNGPTNCSAWSTPHTVSVSSPPANGPSATVDYSYDALGRLIEVNDSISGSLEYQYDSAGNRTQVSETAATQ